MHSVTLQEFCICLLNSTPHSSHTAGNNEIDFNEFLLLVERYETPLSNDDEICEMFRYIDSDGNGFIDTSELKATFETLGVPLTDHDLEVMMTEANIDGNKIYFEGKTFLFLSVFLPKINIISI